MGQRPLQPIAAHSDFDLEWLTAEDAQFLAQAIARIAREEARQAVAEQLGAHRAYAWAVADPNSTPAPPLPPAFVIELPCRPVDVLATCRVAPGGPLSVDVLRSIDAGMTFTSILAMPAGVAAGALSGAGAQFQWEEPETRLLVAPMTPGAALVSLLAGDLVTIALSGGAGVRSVTAQLRVQRVGEHRPRGAR